MKISIDVDHVTARLLATIVAETSPDVHSQLLLERVQEVLQELVDHAAQGVYRPGAWERGWLTQAFGDEFTERLEPGDPWSREAATPYFQRPRSEASS